MSRNSSQLYTVRDAHTLTISLRTFSEIGLHSFIVMLAFTVPAIGIDYQQLAEQRLGHDQAGVIVVGSGDTSWEIAAIGRSDIASSADSSPQELREASLIAGALARQSLAEFIEGARVRGRETAIREQRVVLDGTAADRAVDRFIEVVTSRQDIEIHAFLRGTRQVADWRSQDGQYCLIAVALNPDDIRQGLAVTNALHVADQLTSRFQVVQAEGHDNTPKRVRVEGIASKGDRSLAAARRSAIADGLQLAVERVAGITLAGRTSVTNLQIIKSNISSLTVGFIKSFMILQEQQVGVNYRVVLEVEVQKSLAGDMDIIRAFIDNPKVLIWSRGTYSRAQYAVEALHERTIATATPQGEISWGARGDVRAWLALALQSGAGVLLEAYEGDMRLYDVTTGNPIGGEITGFWIGPLGMGKAKTEAAKKLLCDTIVSHWEDQIFNGAYIRVFVNTTRVNQVHQQAAAVRKAMEELPACRSVQQLELFGSADSYQVIFLLRYAGTPQEFLDAFFEASTTTTAGISLQKQQGSFIWMSVH